MATAPLGADSAPANPHYFTQLPGAPLIFSARDRNKLASFVEVAVAFLDAIDGDADREANGDEQDGNFAEDDGAASNNLYADGPGCLIANGDVEHDGQEPDYGDCGY